VLLISDLYLPVLRQISFVTLEHHQETRPTVHFVGHYRSFLKVKVIGQGSVVRGHGSESAVEKKNSYCAFADKKPSYR